MTYTRLLTLCGLVMVGFVTPLFAQDQLVLLSPHWEGVRTEFGHAFEAHYQKETGRTVYLKWLDVGGASDILKFIRSEFKSKPNGIGVDLFFGGGTDPYLELKRLDLLAPYRLPDSLLVHLAPNLNGVPLYDADYTWYAATMAGFGIIYNKVVLKRLGLPEPQTWADLAHPRLFSWVGSADPRKSGSVHMAYEIILQAYGWNRGWQIVTAMGGNIRGFSGNAAQTPKDVALGEVAYGLAIDSYAWAQVREAGEDLIGYVMPEDLTVVNGDAIALLNGTPNRSVAEAFVRFVLSKPGQKLWLLRQGDPEGPKDFELGKFSVMPGLYPEAQGRTPIQLNPFVWRSAFVYHAALGSGRWGIVNDLIGTQAIDVHDRLKATWQQAIDRDQTVPAVVALGVVPVDSAWVADAVARGTWRDPAFRNQTLQEWTAFAHRKYAVAGSSVWQNAPGLIALVFGIGMFLYIRKSRA